MSGGDETPMNHLITIMLIITGIIHVLPVTGVLGSARLTALYGCSFSDPNLAILTRHRAVLFGLLGAFLIHAAFTPALHALAFIAGFVSVMSFLLLVHATPGSNAPIRRVYVADLVALACLLIAAGAKYLM